MEKKDILKKFGAIVKSKRDEKNLTRQEFATNTGLTITQVEKIEEGEIDTPFPTIVIIAKTLQIQLPELLKDFEI